MEQERTSLFKETIDREENQRKRVDLTLNARKKRRQQNVRKRRRDDEGDDSYSHFSKKDIYELRDQIIQGQNNDEILLRCTTEIRKILSQQYDPPVGVVLQAGFLDIFKELMGHSNEGVVLQVVWSITNIVSGDPMYTDEVVNAGFIPYLVNLITIENTEVRDQVVWAIGNIAGDSIQYRDYLLSINMVSLLVPSFYSNKITSLRNSIWTLANLCRGKPFPPLEMVSPCINIFHKLLGDPKNLSQDEEILQDACWTISYITDGSNDRIEMMIENNLVPTIVGLLDHPSINVKIPSLRIIGNLLTGNHIQTQVVLDAGVLDALEGLLLYEKKRIKKDCCWALSNITAGTHEQIESLFTTGIIPMVIDIINGNESSQVRQEATWVIVNATSRGTPRQLTAISNIPGCIGGICDVLKLELVDSRLTLIILEALDNFLHAGKMYATNGNNRVAMEIELCGGLETIEILQTHDTKKIYKLATYLVEEYYEIEAFRVV